MLLRSIKMHRKFKADKKKKKKKKIYFHSNSNSNSEHRRNFEDRPNTSECSTCTSFPRVSITERNRSEQRSSNHPCPLYCQASFRIPIGTKCLASYSSRNSAPNPLPVRPLTTRMTDEERRRLIRIDVDIWIADTRILRHGTRFNPTFDTAKLPPPRDSPHTRFERSIRWHVGA